MIFIISLVRPEYSLLIELLLNDGLRNRLCDACVEPSLITSPLPKIILISLKNCARDGL